MPGILQVERVRVVEGDGDDKVDDNINSLYKVGLLRTLQQQNRLQANYQMGVQCAKTIHPVNVRQHSNNQMLIEREMSRIKQVTSFEIIINNLKLINQTKSFLCIKIELSGAFAFTIPYQEFSFQEHLLKSNRTYTAQFQASLHQLADKYMLISLQQKSGGGIELLRIKMNELLRGPVRHDHLLRQLKSRLLFDLHIEQYVHTDVWVEPCEIKWEDASRHSDYTYSLSLIFSNCRSPIQAKRIFEKHEKIKELTLQHTTIKNNQLKDAILRIKLVDNLTQDHIFQYFLPLSKLQQQNGFKTVNISQITYELRQFKIDQNIVLQDQSIGIIGLHVKFFRSKLFAQQMQCVILSEEGIVMHTMSQNEAKGASTALGNQLKHEDLIAFLSKMQSINRNGISEYDLYLLLQNLYVHIQEKHFPITDQLFRNQQHLLNLLLILAQFLDNDKQLQNQYVWNIINYLSREHILNLKYFFGIKNQQGKISFSKKFYQFIVLVFNKIIKLTANGISFKQLISIHKFIAFAYFRFPWCQEEIVTTLHKKGDPLISQQKLAEIGASYALKSPSKNYFYDWEASVFRLVRKDRDFLSWMGQLEDAKRSNSSWAKLLFDRDYEQLFYSIYSQLWDQGQAFLNNNGKILWEYFPKYGALLSIFFGEMNSSKITDFSAQMTKCNMKLIKNQKLLTTFMMLIFPKTHLFETYCVIKCLNLIECYFTVILDNHKKLPYNFHYNYFYTGIKCILQSQHSYLLQKLLSILYKFYFIFNQQFKETINHFIVHKVFYKLFLHWSQDVRALFHLLLIFKIYDRESENPQVNAKKGKNPSDIQIKLHYEHIVSSLSNRLHRSKVLTTKPTSSVKNELFERMKAKLAKKSGLRASQRQSAALSEFQEVSQNFANRKRSYIENGPITIKRKWSTAEQFESDEIIPEQQKLKYLQASLREYEQAKRELRPNEKVQARSRMFQLEADQ